MTPPATDPGQAPRIFDPDGAHTWMWDLNDDPTADQVRTVAEQLGRIHYPCLLAELLECGLLTEDAATALVGDAWGLPEYPEDSASGSWTTPRGGQPSRLMGVPGRCLTGHGPSGCLSRWSWFVRCLLNRVRHGLGRLIGSALP